MKKKGFKRERIRADNLTKVKFICPHCGRKATMPYWIDKQMCTWCGHWVYRNEQEEFKCKLKTALLKSK